MSEPFGDPYPTYPHNFLLVKTRDRIKERNAAAGRELDFQQGALVERGFAWDWWLPLELARRWKSSEYPTKRTTESVSQWLRLLRESVGMAQQAAARSTELERRRRQERTAGGIARRMEHDVALLRRFDATLVQSGRLRHKRGRKKLSDDKKASCRAMAENWERYKGSGTGKKKDFCKSEGITSTRLNAILSWKRNRDGGAANK
jgi:hypothetical protein